jgi:hypothetical protein
MLCPDDERPGDAELTTEPGDIVGEPADRVLLLWLVAFAVPPQSTDTAR